MRKRIIVMIFAVLALAILAVSCGHKHSYTEQVVAPTCTDRGYTKYTCSCGDEYLDNFVDTTHTFVEEIVEPTCKDEGYTMLKCSLCGYTERKAGSEVAATGNHTWEWRLGEDSTCSKDGWQKQQCTVCKTTGKTEIIAKKDHDYEDQIMREATCTEDGLVAQICKLCGYQNGEGVTIDALGHDWVAGTPVAPTCTQDGYTLYTCSRCNAVDRQDVVTKLGHTYVDTVVPPTCKDQGYTVHLCSRCNGDEEDGRYSDTLVPALGHSIDEVTPYQTVAPTCIKDGYKIFACTRCCTDSLVGNEGTKGDGVSAWYKEVIDATGAHVFDVVNEVVPASCDRPSYTIYGCSADDDCTATNEVDVDGSVALGHDWVLKEQHESTCARLGYDLYECSRCQETYEDNSSYSIVDHTKIVESANTVAPTCITNGYTEYECSVCHLLFRPEDEITLATGVHGGWVATDEVIAPTCSSEGYTVYKCTLDPNCTETDNQDITERTAHSFVDVGAGIITCTVCEHTYQDIMYTVVVIPDEDITGDKTLGESGIDVEITGSKPGTPITLTDTTPLAIVIPEGKSADEGIVRITTDDSTVKYTVEIQKGGEWIVVKADLTGSEIFVDLYKYTGITAIRVTADADANATITIYA